MKKLWFKAKDYGWGWYPASVEGWLVLGIFVGLIVYDFIRINAQALSVAQTLLIFIPRTIILTIVLLYVCYKTGEKPSWRWTKKTKSYGADKNQS